MNYGLNNNITRNNNMNSAFGQRKKSSNANFETSKNIATAYQQLKSDNAIDRAQGLGTIVAEIMALL